jgi:quercetin dioxygenase-like cupin family protein
VTTFLPSDSVVRDQLDWGQLGWVSRPETTGAEQLVVLDVVLTPGGCHDFHKHPDQEEVLFVISGTIEQWVGEEKRMLSAGDAAFIPKDTVHALSTTAPKTLVSSRSWVHAWAKLATPSSTSALRNPGRPSEPDSR